MMEFEEIMQGLDIDDQQDPMVAYNEAVAPFELLGTAVATMSGKAIAASVNLPEHDALPVGMATVIASAGVLIAVAKAMSDAALVAFPEKGEQAVALLMHSSMDEGIAEGERLVARIKEIGNPTVDEIVALFQEDPNEGGSK